MNDNTVCCQSRDVTEPQRDREGGRREASGGGVGVAGRCRVTEFIYHKHITRSQNERHADYVGISLALRAKTRKGTQRHTKVHKGTKRKCIKTRRENLGVHIYSLISALLSDKKERKNRQNYQKSKVKGREQTDIRERFSLHV